MAEIGNIPYRAVSARPGYLLWRLGPQQAYQSMLADPERAAQYLQNATGQSHPLLSALSLLRSTDGQMYIAGPGNREASDGSGPAPDGIGTDPVGFARNLAADELGPELNADTSLTNSALWSGSATSANTAGGIVFTAAANGDYRFQLSKLALGAPYEVTFTLAAISAGHRARVWHGTSSADYSAPGTYTVRGIATADRHFGVQVLGTAVSATFTHFSIREVRAAYQTTTAAKPRLVREPILGPELVVGGGMDSASPWGTPTNGTSTVSNGRLVITSTVTSAGTVFVNQALTGVAGKTYRCSCQGFAASGTAGLRFSLKRGAVGGFATIALADFSATQDTVKYFDAVATGDDLLIQLQYQGTFAVGAQLSWDNISVREILGYKDVRYWEFGGDDDRLQFVPPSNFQLQNGGLLMCCVVTPLRVPSTNDIFLSVGASAVTTSRMMVWINAVNNRVLATVFGTSGGTEVGLGGAYVAQIGTPIIVSFWVSGGQQYLRVNGAQIAASALSATPVSAWNTGRIGARHSDAAFANVRVQAPVIAPGITTLAQVQTIERAVAAAAGVTLA